MNFILSIILLITSDIWDHQSQYADNIKKLNRYIEICDYKGADIICKNIMDSYMDNIFYEDSKKLVFVKFKLNNRREVIDLLLTIKNLKKLSISDISKDFQYVNLTSLELKNLFTKHEAINPTFNREYYTKLKLLFKNDQDIRNYDSLKIVTEKSYKELFIIRDSIDKIHGNEFLDLINNYGFPTENNIGAKFNANLDLQHTLRVLGIHFCLMNDKLYALYEKAMKDGLLHPSIFASVSDFVFENSEGRKGKNFMSSLIHKTEQGIYKPFIIYSDSLMQSVNSNRFSIGLDSFHLAQRQTLINYGRNCNDGSPFQVFSYPFIEEFGHDMVKQIFEMEGKSMEEYVLKPIIKDCLCTDKF